MTTAIRPDDPALSWEGAISLARSESGVQPWRIPHEERSLYFDVLADRAGMPAGVRLTFRSDTTTVAGEIEPRAEMSNLDLCCDGELVESSPMDGRARFEFTGLPKGEKTVELWLPQFQPFLLKRLEIDAGASLAKSEDRRPRWVTYGSSITQCRAAASPTQTWPAVVARGHNLNLTCLGFGGQCHLDPLIARVMRDGQADYLSMCVGINIYGAGSLNPRTFGPGIVGFVQIVREKHPDTPFAIVSPIYSPPRETKENAVGFTLAAMREEVERAVSTLRAHGDRHVYYVNGLDVFGPDLGHLLPDELHPNAEGYRTLGRNFLRVVAEPLFR